MVIRAVTTAIHQDFFMLWPINAEDSGAESVDDGEGWDYRAECPTGLMSALKGPYESVTQPFPNRSPLRYGEAPILSS